MGLVCSDIPYSPSKHIHGTFVPSCIIAHGAHADHLAKGDWNVMPCAPDGSFDNSVPAIQAEGWQGGREGRRRGEGG